MFPFFSNFQQYEVLLILTVHAVSSSCVTSCVTGHRPQPRSVDFHSRGDGGDFNSRNPFSRISGARSPRSRCQWVWLLLRPLPGRADSGLLPVSPRAVPLCVPVSPSPLRIRTLVILHRSHPNALTLPSPPLITCTWPYLQVQSRAVFLGAGVSGTCGGHGSAHGGRHRPGSASRLGLPLRAAPARGRWGWGCSRRKARPLRDRPPAPSAAAGWVPATRLVVTAFTSSPLCYQKYSGFPSHLLQPRPRQTAALTPGGFGMQSGIDFLRGRGGLHHVPAGGRAW